MNKRQAKKAFKKKYGVNPNEVIDMIFCLVELTHRKVDEYVGQFKAPEQIHEDSGSERNDGVGSEETSH